MQVTIERAVFESSYDLADAQKKGLIKVMDRQSEKVICEMPTNKTDSQNLDITQYWVELL